MEDSNDVHVVVGNTVEPVEFLDGLAFALESLQHNITLVTYMHSLAERNEYGRTDELIVFQEIGGKDGTGKRDR